MILGKSHKYFIAIVTFALCMTGCSSIKEEQPVMHNEVRVLFTYEGFCGVGYNDMTLAAIEKCSQQYGFEYSFFVPENLEAGMEDYRNWLNKENSSDVKKSLYIFASNAYEKLLEQEKHPDSDSGKEILLFESEKAIPHAYSFAISYYGSSYMIGRVHQAFCENKCDFKIIAANPYMLGLERVVDGFRKSIEGAPLADVEVRYLSDEPGGGFDKQEDAYLMSLIIETEPDELGQVEVIVPLAGASNLGVYRYSHHHIAIAIGVDYIGNFYNAYLFLSMNKRMDLALSDFFSLWISGEEVPKHRLYTLESGRVEVLTNDINVFPIDPEDYEQLVETSIAYENEYFRNKGLIP